MPDSLHRHLLRRQRSLARAFYFVFTLSPCAASQDSLDAAASEVAARRAALDLELSLLRRERAALAADRAALNAERAALMSERPASTPSTAANSVAQATREEPRVGAKCFDGNLTFWNCCLGDALGHIKVGCGVADECCKDHAIWQSLMPVWYVMQVSCWGLAVGSRFDYMQQSACCTVPTPGCFGGGFTREYCCSSPSRIITGMDFDKGELPRAPGTSCTRDGRRLACHWTGRPQGVMIYCGERLRALLYDLVTTVSALHFSLLAWDVLGSSEDLASFCADRVSQEIRGVDPRTFPAVVLLAPSLTEFDVLIDGHALDALAGHLRDNPRLGVLGLPTVANGSWEWPIFKIRRAYWKLAYSPYPTGYSSWIPDSDGLANCYGGDSTSGTRVYNASFLHSLLADWPADLGSAWLVHLDLRAKVMGVPAFTCLTPWAALLHEESYLRSAELTPALARYHDVEAAKFHAASEVQHHCVGARTDDEMIDSNLQGLVTSYCYRLALRDALHELRLAWAEVASEDRTAKPVLGTALALFRGGIIPWDTDADVVLTSTGVSVPELQARLERSGFKVKLSNVYSPLVREHEQHLVLQRTSLGSVAEIDAWIQNSQPLLDVVLPSYAVNVSGFPMNTSRALLTKMLTKVRNGAYVPAPARLFGYAAKLDKSREMLICKRPGHNACVPDFELRGGFVHGEFLDNFVHLDVWF